MHSVFSFTVITLRNTMKEVKIHSVETASDDRQKSSVKIVTER